MINMRNILAITLAVILIFSMTACQSSGQISCPAADEPVPINAPGSNGASKPTSKEPPVLLISDESGNTSKANTGTYIWTYDNGDGTKTGVCADSTHPLEWQEFVIPMTTTEETIELKFAVSPQEYSVRRWNESCWEDVDAISEKVEATGDVIELTDGGYIYEVVAKWTGESLNGEGTVHYGFYVIKTTPR